METALVGTNGRGRLSSHFPERPTAQEGIVNAIRRINGEEHTIYMRDQAARKRFKAMHRTKYLCIGCMDGRCCWRAMTKTPTGITRHLHAIGGKFATFWSGFLAEIDEQVEKAVSQGGQRNLVFVSYHYSASGNKHLNCAGHGYNTEAAIAHATELARELERIYGDQIVPIVTGMETDEDMLVLHGPDGKITGAELIGRGSSDVYQDLRHTFPQLSDTIVHDLAPFMLGNAECVSELKASPRQGDDLDHGERIIVVGNRCEWLTQSNLGLVIHPSDPNLDEAIHVAARIIEKNLERPGFDGDVAIFANIEYEEPGKEQRAASSQAAGLLDFACRHIQERNPGLWKSCRLNKLSGITFGPTKQLEILQSVPIGHSA